MQWKKQIPGFATWKREKRKLTKFDLTHWSLSEQEMCFLLKPYSSVLFYSNRYLTIYIFSFLGGLQSIFNKKIPTEVKSYYWKLIKS